MAAGETADEDLWRYTASNDGLTHWLRLLAVEAEVRTPYGTMTTDRWPGQGPPMIEAHCRESEMPLTLLLVMSAHPKEPIPHQMSLRSLWWSLTGTTPASQRYPTAVRLGDSEFESTFELPAHRYLEPDATIRLDVQAGVRELLQAAERPLHLEAAGRTRVKARFEVPEDYRAWLRARTVG